MKPHYNKSHKIHKPIKKYNNKTCDEKMTFDECELAILRAAVDETEEKKGREIVNNDEIKKILKIVENFIIRKKLILYGGTAINNILPKFAQFYDRDIELPDYDFYSKNALEDAKELADIYYKEGYLDIEAKSGVHMGTFKVFVNFIPIADITQLNSVIFDELSKDTIKVSGMRHCPANFLRMNMYLELSRPSGDVSRWEKILKRLILLNKFYPLKTQDNCTDIDFQRKLDVDMNISEKIYITTRDAFINQGVIFFGGYAVSLYARYMSEQEQHAVKKIADFDVLSEEPEKCALIVKERLQDEGFKHIKMIHHPEVGEIVPACIEINVNGEVVAFIYKPIACHSYNTIRVDEQEINIATIDTILTFYFSFIYTKRPYYTIERLLCMAKFLFDVEQRNRLAQNGLLKRFSINCYGKQKTLEGMRAEKAEKFKELGSDRNSIEYQMWFLKYSPGTKEGVSKKRPVKNIVKDEKPHNIRKTQKVRSKKDDYLV
uniref:Poly(A) polymerase catalytic subunit domain-containing protein n=1 Tax=viral metagenome TaxID=1070528 RepID=A0A6C0DQZ6_9ZZZZ